jgi:hypothetical protein
MIGLGFDIPKIASNADEDVELGYELFITSEDDVVITSDDEMMTVLS